MKVARMEDFPYILPYNHNHPPYPTPCLSNMTSTYIYVPVYLPLRKKII